MEFLHRLEDIAAPNGEDNNMVYLQVLLSKTVV